MTPLRVAEEPDVDALGRELLARSFPRLQMMLLLAVAGLGAFLSSFAMLHGGLTSMPVRYFIAAAVGYLLFLALVRAWLAHQRRLWASELADLAVELPSGGGGSSATPPFTGGGGGFGGGGASGRFAADDVPAAFPVAPLAPTSPSTKASSSLFEIPDADEALPIALVVLVAIAIAAAASGIVLVVWASPALFAEVLLDAALVGAVYRRARHRPRSHWLSGVFRRTWLAALALCAIVSAAGFALEVTHPGAHSLRTVIQAWD